MKHIPGKIGVICLMAVLLLSFLASCANAPVTTPLSPSAITDQLGRQLTLKTLPQRIVSLAPSNTEILFALGLADRMVGGTDYDTYPPEAKQKPSIGGFSTPNIEKVIALSPDLVLATSIHEKQVIPQLEARGLTVVALAPKTVNDILDSITLVGKITGKEKQAADLVARMRNQIKAITDKTNNLPATQKPRVFYVTWSNPLMSAGSGTIHDELIRTAGGINIAANLNGYPSIALETVVAANPQVIIAGVGMGTGADAPFQFVRTEPRLQDTDARQHNRVYSVDVDLVGHAGPRIADALEQFARFIHPELFGEAKP